MPLLAPTYPDGSRTVSNSSSAAAHPLNVKPLGNALLADPAEMKRARLAGLGHWARLPDELIMTLMSYLPQDDVVLLSQCLRILYAFGYDEEMWKKLYLSSLGSAEPERWLGSWRLTARGLQKQYSADLQLKPAELCSDALYRPFQCSQVDYPELFHKVIREEERYHKDALKGCLGTLPPGRIARLDEKAVSLDRFNDELHDTPFILTNLDNQRWPRWDAASLLLRFADARFRQEAVQWRLAAYLAYMADNMDESPLYLFDCKSEAIQTLRQEYKPPAIFDDDYFKVFTLPDGKTCRPDHAWLIVGPQRSGLTFHKDPNYTLAWNTALSGRKLWVMLPPLVLPPGVGTDGDESEVTLPVGIAEWVLSGFYNDTLHIPEALVAVTFPGECMYVPLGWWHLVINIDDLVALTQNFVPALKLANALHFMKKKSNQLSGFRANPVRAVIDEVVKTHPDEALSKFVLELDSLNVDGDEDCAELACELHMPVFELFCKLMEMAGNKAQLDDGLEKLEAQAKPSKPKWTNVISNEGSGGFSFGFDIE